MPRGLQGFQKGHKGYFSHHSKAMKDKLSADRMGKNNPNWKGSTVELICHNCKKMFKGRIKPGIRRYCSIKCSKSCLEKNQEASDRIKGKYGEKTPNWQGGVTPEHQKIRTSIQYSLWHEAVFARDNWTCQKCFVRGGKLDAHHIKGFSKYPELRFAIDNGQTLCKKCHGKTKNYGKARI